MIELLEKLCALPGPSGCEDAVHDFILEQAKPYADEIREDHLGNLMIFRKGKQHIDKTVMLSAHMDEVGFIITGITTEGFLRFTKVVFKLASYHLNKSGAADAVVESLGLDKAVAHLEFGGVEPCAVAE